MKTAVFYSCTMTLLASAIAAAFAPTAAASPSANHTRRSKSAVMPAAAQSVPNPQAVPAKSNRTQSQNSQANPTDIKGITVTSIRQSLGSALEIKRNSQNIVDSIVAEGIGKLPDHSVADSLQRVTGVQVSRANSQTNGVVIRGLPNVVTTVDGREIFSGSTRGFSFQDLPAQAVKGLNVYKTSSANLVAGGVAGLVNIQLFKPFDFKGLEIAGTLKGNHAEDGHKVQNGQQLDPEGNFLISDRWDTNVGEIGALVNVSYRAQHYDYPSIFTDPYQLNSYPDYKNGKPFAGPPGVYREDQSGYRRRPEANYALQWRPNDHWEVYAEGLSDGYRETNGNDYFFSTIGEADSAQDVKLFSPNTPHGCFDVDGKQTCALQSGTFRNGYTVVGPHGNRLSGHDTQNAIGVKWHAGGWQAKSDLSYTGTSLKSRLIAIDNYINTNPNHRPYRSNFTTIVNTNEGGHLNWNILESPQFDKDHIYLSNLFQTFARQKGNQIAWSNRAEYDFLSGFVSKIQFGVRYARHKANFIGATQNATKPTTPNELSTTLGPGYLTHIRPNTFTSQLPQWLSGDPYWMLSHSPTIRRAYGLPDGPPDLDPGREFHADEKTYSGYLQLGYQFDIGDVPVSGLVGARLVHKKRTLTAQRKTNGVYAPVTFDTSATHVLPNISARFALTRKLNLRLAAARTISYPKFSDLNPARSLFAPTNNALGFGSSGNPELKPIKSDSYDAELAWYFAPQSSVSLTGFYHKISGYIQTYSGPEIINGLLYNIKEPRSSGGGTLKGAEAAYQQFFTFLPGALSGLGLQLNYTYIKGRADSPSSVDGPTKKTRFANVSRDNYNAILIYEKYGVSARLAYTYRNKYVANFSVGGVVKPNQELVQPANMLDLSIGYAINDHWTVTFDGTNLNHSKYHSYLGSTLLPFHYTKTDTTYSVGVRYKLK